MNWDEDFSERDKYVEFDTDFLDPLFVSEPSLSEVASEIRKLSEKYGVEIHNYFTGAMTHCVERYIKWSRLPNSLDEASGFGSGWINH